MSHTIVAIAAVIKSCGDAKRRVRQNKKRCTHLVDDIEALAPVLETVKTNEVQHAETLKKLMRVVEDAEALLKRQSARSSFILRMCTSSSVAEDFDDIDRRLASCTRFLTLSQSALNNAMLSAMSPSAENAPSRESPASPPSPSPPPKQESNSRGHALHDGDVEILSSWRKQNGVLAKLWAIDACPTTWDGVRFDSSTPRRVTQILLGFKRLSGSIPKELGQLASLKELELNSNQLSGSIPKELGQLASLQRLRLDNNQLSGSIPEELGQLASLQSLVLSVNQLSGSIPKELQHL